MLVADEQTILDNLKDKAIEMQRKLEEEARKLEPPKDLDPKTVMKDRLREKLEMTIKKRWLEVDAVATKTPAEPSPPPSSGGPSPQPQNLPPQFPPPQSLCPILDAPRSLAVSASHYQKKKTSVTKKSMMHGTQVWVLKLAYDIC